jgi:hypothetical protein
VRSIPLHFYAGGAERPKQKGHKNGAGRNERTTTQTDPFQANPLGRGQLADFPRCSLLTYDLDMLVVRALKISQLADGGMPPTYDSTH